MVLLVRGLQPFLALLQHRAEVCSVHRASLLCRGPWSIATLRSFLFPVTVISDPGFYMFYFLSSVRSVKEQNKDQKQKSLSLSLPPSKKEKNEKQKHSRAESTDLPGKE